MKYSTDQFIYTKVNKLFAAEASDLEDLTPRYWNSLRTIPVKKTIELYNPKTKISKTFYFAYCDIRDGEVMGWNYRSVDGYKLLLIND